MALYRCGASSSDNFKFVAITSSGSASVEDSYTVPSAGKRKIIATGYSAWSGDAGTVSVAVLKNNVDITSSLTKVNDSEVVTSSNHVTSYTGSVDVEANDVLKVSVTVSGSATTPSFTVGMLQIA